MFTKAQMCSRVKWDFGARDQYWLDAVPDSTCQW